MRLIIVDGLDGVGKDTHANLIKKRYEEKGEKVAIRSHPTSDNYFGRKAKNALLGRANSTNFKHLFSTCLMFYGLYGNIMVKEILTLLSWFAI